MSMVIYMNFKEIRNNPEAALCVHENESREVKVSFGRGKDNVFFACGNYIPCDVVFPVLHGTYGAMPGIGY